MAIVLAFRLAIAAVPLGIAVVRWSQGPAAVHLSREDLDRLAGPQESDESKSAWLGQKIGRVVDVTTFSDTFECRKLHAVFGRSSGGSVPEDDAICTFHFLKLAAGVPVDTWDAADFIALETAFDAAWGASTEYWSYATYLRQLRWYKTGPQVDIDLNGVGRTGPPVRVVDRDIHGSASAGPHLPAQVAVSVTEKTTNPKAWGRFYLPAPSVGGGAAVSVGNGGRWNTAFTTDLADGWDGFYEAALGNDTPVVVYSSAKPERPSKGGGTLPAVGARAFTVDELQIDDIPDVIRSRRVAVASLRTLRAIG